MAEMVVGPFIVRIKKGYIFGVARRAVQAAVAGGTWPAVWLLDHRHGKAKRVAQSSDFRACRDRRFVVHNDDVDRTYAALSLHRTQRPLQDTRRPLKIWNDDRNHDSSGTPLRLDRGGKVDMVAAKC